MLDLNTSHVILYHERDDGYAQDIFIFKYISCYSLSLRRN